MGRPFERELSFIPATVRLAGMIQLEELPRHIHEASSGHVILVGAGGSLSSAEFCQKLFDDRGVTAQAMTPQSFIESHAKLHEASIFIFTARGNNKDVLAAFLAAWNREAKKIVVICAARHSKVASLAGKCSRSYIYSFQLPSGRDGYLATNSLVATCIILARAFGAKSVQSKEAEGWLKFGKKAFIRIGSKRTHIVILYSGWAKLAAVDLESKLSEAGVVASMLADLRHFAHGRHNWLDKQGNVTAVILLESDGKAKLSDATIKNLPVTIPLWRCTSKSTGSEGALELLLAVFGFVSAAAEAVGIDPGRPGVPDFGSRLYNLGPIGLNSVKVSNERPDLNYICERKAGRLNLDSSSPFLIDQATLFIDNLTATKFGALVTDYDGTVLPLNARNGPIPPKIAKTLVRLLEHNIPIFFATGRGDSIDKILKSAFSKELWPLVNIGYYNGSITLPLDNTAELSKQSVNNPIIDEVERLLLAHPIFGSRLEIKNKKWQITIRAKSNSTMESIIIALREYISKQFDALLRLVVSSHSVDILPSGASKTNCIIMAQKQTEANLKVLTVGDCGSAGGNDYQLLQHPYSLSVDKVSTALDSCWNLLPAGMSHADGFYFYMKLFKILPGKFLMKSPL